MDDRADERTDDLPADDLTIAPEPFDGPAMTALLAELPWGVGDLTAPEFTPPAGIALVARAAGEPVACAGVRRFDAATGEVKRLFVVPAHQRRGIARRMLAAAEEAARGLGYATMRLDTHNEGPAALFRSAGYAPTPAYNENAYARFWFAKPL